MLQDDIPCLLVARAGLLGKMPCILLCSLPHAQSSSFPHQHGPIAELSLPKVPSRCAWLSPVTATQEVCITLMMFRFPLHGSLNLAPSLGTFWPTRLRTNLEVVKICADLQVFTRYPWRFCIVFTKQIALLFIKRGKEST